MVSKKALAILLLTLIVVSLVGTAFIVVDMGKDQRTEIAQVKLYVAQKEPQKADGLVKMNVIAKQT